MIAKIVDYHGIKSFQLENDFLKVVIAEHSGDIIDLVNKKTGRHQLWVAEKPIMQGAGEYGIRLPWIGKPTLAAELTCEDDKCALSLEAVTDTLSQCFVFTLDDSSAALRVTHTLKNISNATQSPDSRVFYYLNVASEAEKSGILSGCGPQFNSITVPHGKHRFFAGAECKWRGMGRWEKHEAGEEVYEPSAYREKVWLRPRWFAVMDSQAAEGVAVRFDRTPGFIRTFIPLSYHSYSICVEQDFNVAELASGESKTFHLDIAAVNGLSRVDHVGPACALEVDLTAALRLTEKQEITVRASAFRPGEVQGKFCLHTHCLELEDDIQWNLRAVGQIEERHWRGGPYGTKEYLEAIWFYAHRKPGDCSRPTPRVEVHVDGARIDRWFTSSPENEEVLERIEVAASNMQGRVKSGDAPKELASALRVIHQQADELRKERIDPDAMYVLLDRAESMASAQVPNSGFSLFDQNEIRAIIADKTASTLLQDIRQRVLAKNDSYYAMGAPGRRAYTHSFDLASHAAYAAICRLCFKDADCGKRAVRALMVFADDFEQYHLTGAGNVLHLSIVVPALIAAYDLVSDLLDARQEIKIQAYFFWLADLLEGHVNAKGDNDEIHEAGAIAWLAARFPYLPDSARKLRRAHAVFCRQARVIDADGGWPESPNYNAQITAGYMAHAFLMKRAGMPIHTGQTGVALKRLLDWFVRILTPDYRIPMLGDGVGRRIGSDTFFLGAALFDAPQYLAIAKEIRRYEEQEEELSIGRCGPMLLVNYPVGMAAAEVKSLPIADTLPSTGYVLLRSGNEPDSEFLVSDYGPHKPGHGHMDKLSFEFYAFCENLIRDTGYGITDSKNHNLVLVDGRNQERLCGKLESLETDSDGIVRAVISAETLPGVKHTRRFIYSPSQWLLMHDELVSSEEHEYSWRVHFNGQAQVEEDGFVYKSSSGPGLALQPLGAKATLEDAVAVSYSEKGISHYPIHRLVMTDVAVKKEFLALLVAFRETPPSIGLEWQPKSPVAVIRVANQVKEMQIRL